MSASGATLIPSSIAVDPRVAAVSLEALGVLLRLYLVAGQCSPDGDRVPLPRGVAFAAAAKLVVGEQGVAPMGELVEAGLVEYDREGDALQLVIVAERPQRHREALDFDDVPRARPKDLARIDERSVAKKLSGLFSKYGLRDADARLRWFESERGRHTIERLGLTAEQVLTFAHSAGRRSGRVRTERDMRSPAPGSWISHSGASSAEAPRESACVPSNHALDVAPTSAPTTTPTTEPTSPTPPTSAPTSPTRSLSRAVSESSVASNNQNHRAAAAADAREQTRSSNPANSNPANSHSPEPALDDASARGPDRAACIAVTRELCERLRPNELMTDGGSDVREGIGRCVLIAAERDARLSSPEGLDALADAIRHPARTWPNWNVVARRQRRVSLTLLAGQADPSGERPYTVLHEALAAAADAITKRERSRSATSSQNSSTSRPGPVASADFFRNCVNPSQKAINDV